MDCRDVITTEILTNRCNKILNLYDMALQLQLLEQLGEHHLKGFFRN